jgi:hypothetical protein
MISRIWPDQDVVDVRRLEMMTADGLHTVRRFATGEFHSETSQQ